MSIENIVGIIGALVFSSLVLVVCHFTAKRGK